MPKLNPHNWLEDTKEFVIKFPYSGLKGFHSWVLFSARNLMEVSYGELDWLLPANPAPAFLKPIKDYVTTHYRIAKEPEKLIFYLPLFEYSITHDIRRLGVIKEFLMEFFQPIFTSNSIEEYDPCKVLEILHQNSLNKFGFTFHTDIVGAYLVSENYHKYEVILFFKWDTHFDNTKYVSDLLKSPDFSLLESDLFKKTKSEYISDLVSRAEQGDRASRQTLIEYTTTALDLKDPFVWEDCGIFLSKFLNKNPDMDLNKKILNLTLSFKTIRMDKNLLNKSFYFKVTLKETNTQAVITFNP